MPSRNWPAPDVACLDAPGVGVAESLSEQDPRQPSGPRSTRVSTIGGMGNSPARRATRKAASAGGTPDQGSRACSPLTSGSKTLC